MRGSPYPHVTTVAAWLTGLWAACASPPPCVRADEPAGPPPVSIRINWGGGRPRLWKGVIGVEVREDRSVDEAPLPPGGRFDGLRSLAADDAANGSFHVDRGRILLHAPRPRAFDGIDLTLHEWTGAVLTIELRPDDGGATAVKRFSVPLDDLLAARRTEPLDDEGNRLVVTRTPGDDIRIRFPSHAAERCPTLRAPGDALEMHVQPVLRGTGSRGEHSLRARLVDAAGTKSLFEAEMPVGRPGDSSGGLTVLREVPLVVPMPAMTGGYEIQFSVAETGSLRWSRPAATRSVAVAVMDRSPRQAPAVDGPPADLIYELDPGSPKLIERIRRLPGLSAVPTVSMPQVPSMPGLARLPQGSFGLSSRPGGSEGFRMPTSLGGGDNGLFTAVRGLDSLVPRGGGLLAHGFSSLETHSLGPVLRLPPAANTSEPAWEAIAIPAALPGKPHLLEIDYPTDQRATLAVAVFETDAAGALLPPARAGGFRVEPLPLVPQPPSLGTFLLPFWPSTRSPVVVVANPSTSAAAMIGRLRVRAGGDGLVLGGRSDAARRRPVRGVLLEPSFHELGVAAVSDPQTGQAVQTWSGLISGAERLADLLSARRAGGAMVCVYADGAACWPTTVSPESPLWDGGAFAPGGADPVRKDLVAVLCRAFDRRSLELVPGIDCSGPIAELEEVVARGGPLAMGIECTGPDGTALPPAGGVRRYNPLDPRVQDAVTRLADDLASHVAGRTAVQSIAIVASAEGWLQLPGAASCLDDATIARFARESGIDMPSIGADRFAERARLVEGPIREAWLTWRARRMAAFYRRLAEVVAGRDGTLDLHVVATDLDAVADESGRPATGAGALADPAGRERMLEAGIAPGLIASHPRIVFVAPHASADPLDLGGLAEVERVNAAVMAAVRGDRSARLGGIATKRPVPVELAGIVRHLGGAGKPSGSTQSPFATVATGPRATRALAESLALGDLECFYDGSLLDGVDAESIDTAAAFAALPAGGLAGVAAAPEPLVVRSASDGRATWICLVNPAPVGCSVRVVTAGCGPLRDSTGAAVAGTPDAWAVSLRPWESRVLQADGVGRVAACEVLFEPLVRDRMAVALESLTRRRAALENPASLEGLDNPSFDLPWAGETLPGWELVDPARGTLAEAAGSADGRALLFTSAADVSSLRSNPFPPPATGRVSVAARLRRGTSAGAPPMRIAVEGTIDGAAYYRYAEVTASLDDQWRSVVLQVEDLPPRGLDSLRVRFDLLGTGSVTIDDVRIYGLAFEEAQRVQLTKVLAAVDQHVRDGSIATAARELDGHWPRFLEAFVPDQPPEVAAEEAAASIAEPSAEPERRASVMDRLRRWWR